MPHVETNAVTRVSAPTTVRMEKGIDIDAGCGQLRARALDEEGLPADTARSSVA